MKILFLAQQLPYPLDSGGKIKSYHFLKALSQEYEIVLLSFIRSEKEKEYLEDLRPFCKRIETSVIKRSFIRNLLFCVLSFLSGKSFVISRDFTSDFQTQVKRLTEEEKPNVMHVDHLQMAQYIQGAGDNKVVLDEHNMEYMIIERIGKSSGSLLTKTFSALESRNLRRFEEEACRMADLVLTVTDKDRESLLELTDDKARIETVPIGVDTQYFQSPISNRQSPVLNTVVFVGTMFWPPNVDAMVWFCREIWEKIKSRVTSCELQKNLKLQIIGRKPTRGVKRLTEQDENIELIEYADDIRPYMQKSKVFIVPLRSGSGMRVKILNAMAMGMPVVSTSIGCEGIEGLSSVSENREANIWIADAPDKFAEAVVTLLRDEELAKKLSVNGRKLMEEKYSWEIISKRLLEVYENQFEKQGTKAQRHRER